MLKGKGILSEFQKAFLQLFASLPDQERFYLTGGTALAEYYLALDSSFRFAPVELGEAGVMVIVLLAPASARQSRSVLPLSS
jgi:hypothetical protein